MYNVDVHACIELNKLPGLQYFQSFKSKYSFSPN